MDSFLATTQRTMLLMPSEEELMTEAECDANTITQMRSVKIYDPISKSREINAVMRFIFGWAAQEG